MSFILSQSCRANFCVYFGLAMPCWFLTHESDLDERCSIAWSCEYAFEIIERSSRVYGEIHESNYQYFGGAATNEDRPART
jgi:hypothetical protein